MVVNLEHFPLLLLLLGLCGPECPVTALPKNLTRARWFEIQHVQPHPLGCNQAMSVVNNYTHRCKSLNTFLHDSFQNVAAACNSTTIICKNGRRNCHQSQNPLSLTDCNLTGGSYPNCRYNDVPQNKFFIVACDPPQKGDPNYPLVPVHLDKTI